MSAEPQQAGPDVRLDEVEAAVAALRACSFSPGERAGQPVAVRVRGFKIRFVLADAR